MIVDLFQITCETFGLSHSSLVTRLYPAKNFDTSQPFRLKHRKTETCLLDPRESLDEDSRSRERIPKDYEGVRIFLPLAHLFVM